MPSKTGACPGAPATANASTRSSTTSRWIKIWRRKMGVRTGIFVPMILRDRAIGVISAHDKEGSRRAVHRRGRPPRRSIRVPSGRGRRPLRARRQRRTSPVVERPGARAAAARPGAARRDRPGTDLDPPQAQELRRRGRSCSSWPARRPSCASSWSPRCRTFAPARRRAAPEGARRFRTRPRNRAACGNLSGADGHRGRPRVDGSGATACRARSKRPSTGSPRRL